MKNVTILLKLPLSKNLEAVNQPNYYRTIKHSFFEKLCNTSYTVIVISYQEV